MLQSIPQAKPISGSSIFEERRLCELVRVSFLRNRDRCRQLRLRSEDQRYLTALVLVAGLPTRVALVVATDICSVKLQIGVCNGLRSGLLCFPIGRPTGGDGWLYKPMRGGKTIPRNHTVTPAGRS